MSEIIKYYVQGHTGKGYVNYLESNLSSIDRIILLESDNPFILSETLQRFIEEIDHETVELIQSIESSQLVEGIILRSKSIAILNERIYPPEKKNEKLIRLAFSTNRNQLNNLNQPPITNQAVYDHFIKGLSIHERLEQIYIQQMDFKKADQIIEKILNELFAKTNKSEKKSVIYERLFGTNTPDGIVNVIPQLINPIGRKIFILGRAGTGKSYLMNQVLERCLDYGIDVEIYRCSLDPSSIDMLIIRQLDTCLHDNTAPHAIPIKDGHIEVIDMYQKTVDQKVEIENETIINELNHLYKKEMQAGLQLLQQEALPTERKLDKIANQEVEQVIERIKQFLA